MEGFDKEAHHVLAIPLEACQPLVLKPAGVFLYHCLSGGGRSCVAYAVPRNGSDSEMETTLVNFRGNCMCHGLLLDVMGTHQ